MTRVGIGYFFCLHQFDENFSVLISAGSFLKAFLQADARFLVFSAVLWLINIVYREDFSAFGYRMLVPSMVKSMERL